MSDALKRNLGYADEQIAQTDRARKKALLFRGALELTRVSLVGLGVVAAGKSSPPSLVLAVPSWVLPSPSVVPPCQEPAGGVRHPPGWPASVRHRLR